MLFFTEYSWCYYDADFSRKYLHTFNVTKSGVPCIPWLVAKESISPSLLGPTSQISNDLFYPDGSAQDAQNYCRNPNTLPHQIWCYTGLRSNAWVTSGIFEYCSPAKCPSLGWYHTNHVNLCQILFLDYAVHFKTQPNNKVQNICKYQSNYALHQCLKSR